MDGDVRFHQIATDIRVLEARQSARRWSVFHENYAFALLRDRQPGLVDWRYRHHTHVVGSEHQVMLLQPGELHTTFRPTPPWSFIVLFVGDNLVKSIASELGWASAALNLRLSTSGLTHPKMVRALGAVRDRLCTTLFPPAAAGLPSGPDVDGHCSCHRSAAVILGAVIGVIQVMIQHYAEGEQRPEAPRRGAAVLRRAEEFLQDQYREPYSLTRLAEATNCGKFYLLHLFKREFGLSPSQYLSCVLVSRSTELLARDPHAPLEEIARRVGWPGRPGASDEGERAHQFIRHFRRALGLTPGQFRAPLRAVSTRMRPDRLHRMIARLD